VVGAAFADGQFVAVFLARHQSRDSGIALAEELRKTRAIFCRRREQLVFLHLQLLTQRFNFFLKLVPILSGGVERQQQKQRENMNSGEGQPHNHWNLLVNRGVMSPLSTRGRSKGSIRFKRLPLPTIHVLSLVLLLSLNAAA